MAYDGNGNYIVPAGTAALAGAIIDATPYNTLLADLQTSLTKCLLRDGQSAAQANLLMGGFKFTGMGAGTSNGDSVRYEQLCSLPKGTYTPVQTVAYAATLAFDAALSNVFEIGALTGNVTSMVIANPVGGQTINVRFVQDVTGSRTVAVPAGAKVSGVLEAAASRVSYLVMMYSTAGARWEGSWSSVPA